MAKLNAAGTGLVFLTVIGGSFDDIAYDVALDGSNNIYLTGKTQSDNFPVFMGLQGMQSPSDAILVCLNAAGNALFYSTPFGGDGNETGWGIALDPSFAKVYITGFSDNSASFNGGLVTVFGSRTQSLKDVFVAKFSNIDRPFIDNLVYLASPQDEEGFDLAVDPWNNVYVTGWTVSPEDFPTTMGAFQTANAGSTDAFLAKITIPAAGGGAATQEYTTYFGGGGDEFGRGVIIHNAAAYVVGDSTTPGQHEFGPMGNTIVPNAGFGPGGDSDVFVLKFGITGDPRQNVINNPFPYFCWFGNNLSDYGWDLSFRNPASPSTIFVTGGTNTNNLPQAIGSDLRTFQGSDDGFVALLNPTILGANTKLFYTYVGGSAVDRGYAIVGDGTNAFAVGYTFSTNFQPTFVDSGQQIPGPPPGFQQNYGGNGDAFAVKIQP